MNRLLHTVDPEACHKRQDTSARGTANSNATNNTTFVSIHIAGKIYRPSTGQSAHSPPACETEVDGEVENAMSEEQPETAAGVVEILTLTLKPGTRDRFHQVYVSEALPLLRKWGFRVIAHGPSRHDENSYFVIRAFRSLEDRQAAEDAYYRSQDWRQGPRATILSMLEHDAYVTVPVATLKEWWSQIVAPVDT